MKRIVPLVIGAALVGAAAVGALALVLAKARSSRPPAAPAVETEVAAAPAREAEAAPAAAADRVVAAAAGPGPERTRPPRQRRERTHPDGAGPAAEPATPASEAPAELPQESPAETPEEAERRKRLDEKIQRAMEEFTREFTLTAEQLKAAEPAIDRLMGVMQQVAGMEAQLREARRAARAQAEAAGLDAAEARKAFENEYMVRQFQPVMLRAMGEVEASLGMLRPHLTAEQLPKLDEFSEKLRQAREKVAGGEMSGL